VAQVRWDLVAKTVPRAGLEQEEQKASWVCQALRALRARSANEVARARRVNEAPKG